MPKNCSPSVKHTDQKLDSTMKRPYCVMSHTNYLHIWDIYNRKPTGEVTTHYISMKCTSHMGLKAHAHYTDIVLNTLNPDSAVEIITPGICGCQWISLISDWPWCRNSSWGGKDFTPSTLALASHDSTDRSHWLTTSSAPEAANTLESMGLQSTEVMGALCCLKFATGRPVYNFNKGS